MGNGYDSMNEEKWRAKEDRERKAINRCNALNNAVEFALGQATPQSIEDVMVTAERLEKWLNRV